VAAEHLLSLGTPEDRKLSREALQLKLSEAKDAQHLVRSKKTLNERLREAATIPAARSTQVEPPTRSRSQSRSRASSPALSIDPLSADEQALVFLGRQLGRARSADSNSPPHLPEDFPADNMDLYEDPF
jgi:hypothetical protein